MTSDAATENAISIVDTLLNLGVLRTALTNALDNRTSTVAAAVAGNRTISTSDETEIELRRIFSTRTSSRRSRLRETSVESESVPVFNPRFSPVALRARNRSCKQSTKSCKKHKGLLYIINFYYLWYCRNTSKIHDFTTGTQLLDPVSYNLTAILWPHSNFHQ